jgi:N-acetyl-anhydromuramyl-L-alanine amidase AmpD
MISKPIIEFVGCYPDHWWPNRIDIFTKKQHKPQAICCHVMQGSLIGTRTHFGLSTTRASAHYGIGLAGQIHQYVMLEHGAWANGFIQKGTWPGIKWHSDVNPNLYTISVEFEGRHKVDERGRISTPDWIPTKAQIDVATDLIAWLCLTYGISANRETVFGHYEVDNVDRPFCPGPLFPFDAIIKNVRQRMIEAVSSVFVDMKSHWARDAADRLYKLGLIKGVPQADGEIRFEPDRPMTRAEAAVLVDRLVHLMKE